MADVNLALDIPMHVQEIHTHRVRKFSFGDGYEQVAADGTNTRMTEYNITTRPLVDADASNLQNDLDKVAVGDFFLITLQPFSSLPRRYRLKGNSYQRQFLPAHVTRHQIFQFTLVESFSS